MILKIQDNINGGLDNYYKCGDNADIDDANYEHDNYLEHNDDSNDDSNEF